MEFSRPNLSQLSSNFNARPSRVRGKGISEGYEENRIRKLTFQFGAISGAFGSLFFQDAVQVGSEQPVVGEDFVQIHVVILGGEFGGSCVQSGRDGEHAQSQSE